jgi:hypothetical protein
MLNLLTYLQKLFGLHGLFAEDHLTGAVDLSDAQYCHSLLDHVRRN